MTAPVFGAIDDLGLGADWEQQSGSPGTSSTRATAGGSDGDVVASNVHNAITTGSTVYIYVGASTDFPAALLADSANPGDILDTDKMVLNVAVDYSPCAGGKRPLVTFQWRANTVVADTPFWYASALTTSLPTYTVANVDVPEIHDVTPGDAEVQVSSWEIGCEFGDDLDNAGDFLVGDAFNGQEKTSLQFVGTPTTVTATGWDLVTEPEDEVTVNTDYGTTTYNHEKSVTRATV